MQAILPRPISVNHVYGTTNRGGFVHRYITKKGQQWFEEAGWLIKQQIKIAKPLIVPLRLEIQAFFIRGDIDNCLKQTLDLLQKMNIIENDDLIIELEVKKFRVFHRKDERIILELKELVS